VKPERGHRTKEVYMSKVLPPAEDEASTQISIRIPNSLIAVAERASKATGHKRSTVYVHFMRWGAQEWEKERAEEKKK
jgi:hypothetical protein